jgi:signal transduction histidine kinase
MSKAAQTSEVAQPAEQLPPHILVLDDEPEIRQMISICLKKDDFRVTCAENVAEACRLMVLGQFDAVISDVMMPGEDGITFLGRVHDFWPDIPVILITGHAQLQMAVNAIKNGAFDFIYKPFDVDYLRKIVLRAVNYSKLQRMEKNYRIELEETVARRTAELKESMAELDYARTALQQAATDKSNFMSTVSHEMRTPMNGVIGSLDLLAEEGLTGSASEFLLMARQSADNMVALIDKLLAFNNVTGIGAGSARYDLIDLSALMNGLVARQLPAFRKKTLTLALRISADVPDRIWTDKEQLLRLLEILLGNALKFTEQGGAKLDITRLDPAGDSVDEGELLFAVTDSGIGIPEGMQERIFEPFVQGDGTFTRRYEGVGLGLAIAMKNALLLNGRLWAENIPEGGSCFKLSLKIIAPQ